MADLNVFDRLLPGEQPTYAELVEAVRQLTEQKKPLVVQDLPMAAIKNTLEQTWQPSGSVLLGPASITNGMLAKDAVAASPISYPARAFATNYRPNLNRATLVTAAFFIGCQGAEGEIIAVCDSGAVPATQITRCGLRNNTPADAAYNVFPMAFPVPAGYSYRIFTSTTAGAPTYSIFNWSELTI